jgi:hypothetical protein
MSSLSEPVQVYVLHFEHRSWAERTSVHRTRAGAIAALAGIVETYTDEEFDPEDDQEMFDLLSDHDHAASITVTTLED